MNAPMKSLCPALFMLVFLFSCVDRRSGFQEDEIRKALSIHMDSYPDSRLTDIYKGFFQDEFGPGHLLEDTAAAWDYFDSELGAMESRKRYEAEVCGVGNNFVRVPLDLVKDSLVDKKEYFRAFLESSQSFSPPDMDVWRQKWQSILMVIEAQAPKLKGFDQDKGTIDAMLLRDQAMIHHSKQYREKYNPHYRIMTLENWEMLRKKIEISF